MYDFGTKADTIAYLYRHQTDICARVLPFAVFTGAEFKEQAANIWHIVANKFSANDKLIIR